MNKNQLYDIENELYKKLDVIKAEQKQYNAGIEKGIDMTVSAVRKGLGEENQTNKEEQTNNCIYCTFEFDYSCGENFPNNDKFNIIQYKNGNGEYGYAIAVNQNNALIVADINYCPICGRFLRGGAKSNDP